MSKTRFHDSIKKKKNSVYPVPTLIYIRKRTIIIYNGIDLTRGSQNRQGDR